MASEIDLRTFLTVYKLECILDDLGYHKFCKMIGYDDIEGSYEGCMTYIYNLVDQYPQLVSFWKL